MHDRLSAVPQQHTGRPAVRCARSILVNDTLNGLRDSGTAGKAGRERSPTHDQPLVRSGGVLSPNDAAIAPTLCIDILRVRSTAMARAGRGDSIVLTAGSTGHRKRTAQNADGGLTGYIGTSRRSL